MKTQFLRSLALAAALALTAGAASATTINLDTAPFANGGAIQAVSPGFGSAGPVTANWNPLADSNTALLHWNGNYSGRDAAYCASGIGCALDLTVASGFEVTLESFFLGGWFDTDRVIGWGVLDLGTNAIVAGMAGATVSGATGLVNIINLTSTTGFRIFFGPDGFNGGVNDIIYTSAAVGPAVVPLPAGGLMLILGLGGLAALRRRRQVI